MLCFYFDTTVRLENQILFWFIKHHLVFTEDMLQAISQDFFSAHTNKTYSYLTDYANTLKYLLITCICFCFTSVSSGKDSELEIYFRYCKTYKTVNSACPSHMPCRTFFLKCLLKHGSFYIELYGIHVYVARYCRALLQSLKALSLSHTLLTHTPALSAFLRSDVLIGIQSRRIKPVSTEHNRSWRCYLFGSVRMWKMSAVFVIVCGGFLGEKGNVRCERETSSLWSHLEDCDGDERAGQSSEFSERFCGGVCEPAGP